MYELTNVEKCKKLRPLKQQFKVLKREIFLLRNRSYKHKKKFNYPTYFKLDLMVKS